MPDVLKKRITVISLFLLLIISLFLMSFFEKSKVKSPEVEGNTSVREELLLKIQDKRICLFKNGKKIKEYDVNVSVLPGEDIKSLSTGISISSISEADSKAEDFDG